MNGVNWDFLVGPLVGSIIGYITNGIAIKMLFRPLKPLYIGGLRLPFTPGVIPREKGRIAKSIGRVVARELINEEVLSQHLLKEEIYVQLKMKVSEGINKGIESEKLLGDLGEQLIGDENLEQVGVSLEEKLSKSIYERVVELNLGNLATKKLLEELRNGLGQSLLGPLSMFVSDSMLEGVAHKIEPVINKLVQDEGRPVIQSMVHQEISKFLNKPIKEIALYLQEYQQSLELGVITVYSQLIKKHLSKALYTLNIEEIVEERINAFDTLELERIILEVMEKELKAIVWLGALLGAIMGLVMNIV
ncbi:DUF445 domain-containing protein [Sporanaerobium hydrogeniformans]|uniref:DUF445 domain-containing protein n=1 Tax=Sporanaerobium hydrogeniformans TaxID=3072179 RepID=UPI0015D518B9|nr:DUF445 family protein [Sporanaerobium hydrogeniformans]